MATKIVFIGKPEMGKTTLKKVIFEGEDPNELILFPLEATIGIKYSIHEFMDSKVSLIDAPGQSLQIILEDEQKQLIVFGDSSAIIYVFDYPTWIADSQDVLDDIRKIYEINKKLESGAKIILFFHKVDLLIKKKIGSMLALIKRQIVRQLDLPEEIPIYFTSLHPNLIYTTFNAISNTISTFSKETSTLKDFIKKRLKDLSKTSCFVSNNDNNLVIQETTSDFDASILYYIYEKIYQLAKSSESISSGASMVSLGSKLLTMRIENIGSFHSNFKNLVIFSEVLENDDITRIIDELKNELSQYFN